MKGKGLSYKEKRAALKNRTKENIENRNKGGFRGQSIMDLSGYDDVSFFKPNTDKKTKRRNLLDLLLYEITTDHHPQGLQKGYLDYILDVWVHYSVGALNSSYICLLKTFGKPCPICEEKDAKIKAGSKWDDQEVQDLLPSHRAIYNVIDLYNPDKGIQIFNAPFGKFEKEMLNAVEEESDDEANPITFADLEEGCSVSFKARVKTWPGGEYYAYDSFQFVEREEPYDESILKETYPLDALMVIPTYDEVRNAHLGLDSESGDEQDTETGADDEVDDDDETDDKKSFEQEANETVEQETSGPADDKDDDDEEDDEEEDDEGDDENNECPHGHKFGKDCDETDDCTACKKWDPCDDEKNRLKKEARKARLTKKDGKKK